MRLNLRYPKINGRTRDEEIAQIKAFLFELVDQLNLIIDKLPDTEEVKAKK